jgi:type IV pilus assembly protein PilB
MAENQEHSRENSQVQVHNNNHNGRNKPLLIGDILLEAGAIDRDKLDEALKEQKRTKKRLGEMLISKGYLTERQLAEALSTQLLIPMISLSRYRPMSEALGVVPQNVAERLEIVPLSVLEDNRLRVAIGEPLNLLALDELRMITGMEIELTIAIPSEIRREIPNFYKVMDSLQSAMVEVVEDSSASAELDISRGQTDATADDAPVIQLVNSILEQAAREGASDIHIEPFEKLTRVRYRVDGLCYDALDFPSNLHPAVSSRLKIMGNMDITERRKPLDGRILIKVLDRRIDLRVSSLPTIYGEKIVLRLLDQQNAMVGLQKLGLEEQELQLLTEMIRRPYGILLVTGPTGSGKSTTLYSVLERINLPEVNIITVEDPVEYTIPGINQVQVDEKAGRIFSVALRSILRQDPDKIMVGEIRDSETAQLAVRAALTGHLVLSTLHTNDAPSAVARLVDMNIAPFLVASSVICVIAQRLVRRLCPFCRQEYELPASVAEPLGIPADSKVYRAVGCDACRGTGYKGRSGIYEIMAIDEETGKLILEGAPSGQIREHVIKKGMRTLRDSGIGKVLNGTTSLEEVMQVTID